MRFSLFLFLVIPSLTHADLRSSVRNEINREEASHTEILRPTETHLPQLNDDEGNLRTDNVHLAARQEIAAAQSSHPSRGHHRKPKK